MRALDSHCHADMLFRFVPDFLREYREKALGGITWSYNEEILSFRQYPAYWDGLSSLCNRFTEEGVPFFYLVGIHPRSIPEDIIGLKKLPSEITDALTKHIENPLCLGLGELGIDVNTPEEERIFRWQLEWAETNLPKRKRVGVHTPRQNKERITEKLLRFLEDYEPLHPFIIIDHVTPTTYDMVYGEGYMAGITLQKGKSAPQDLYKILEQYPQRVKAILVNSDGAKDLSQPYLEWVERHEKLEEEQFVTLALKNALEFFNIQSSE
ncbi:MAG: TatD family hydrolase [Syntrophobacterales bacterium]|nr:TatD family hydrolase [Syntrophobacterales bacterium]